MKAETDKMPERDEAIICATRARQGIMVHHAWQLFAVIGPSLRLRPNLNTGYRAAVVPVSSAPCPHPQLTGKSFWLYVVVHDCGGRRERMSF